jgi:starvation-inducible DNA-binding protein
MATKTKASRMKTALRTPTDLKADAVQEITKALNGLLADVFALYLKTKKVSLAHVGGALSRLSSSAG